MVIPIQNIYYLLSYSWDKLEEKNIVRVSPDDYDQLHDLLAKVLINGCTHLFQKRAR